MPLRLAEPPPQVVDAVRTALLEWAERGGFRTPALSRAKAKDLGLALPHPVYALTLEALAEGRGLSAAEHVGWRFLLQDGERSIASVEVGLGGGEPTVAVNEGPYVRATASALSKLEEMPEVEGHDYELRFLKVMALYVIALWLHEPDGQADLAVPIGELPAGLEADRPYPAADFSARLAEPARKQLEFDSSPPGRAGRS